MEELPTIALSVRQPWAWLIVHGHKTTENRSRVTKFRGPVLINSSSKADWESWDSARLIALRAGCEMPALAAIKFGGIVGVAEIVECKLLSEDPWHMPGYFGWKLTNARPLPFMPYCGALGFFKCVYQNAGLSHGDGSATPTHEKS